MYPKFSRAGQNVARVPEEEQKDRLSARVFSLVEEGPRVPLKTCIIRLCRSMYRINLSAICQRWVVSSVLVKVCNEKAINESIYYVIPFKQLQLQ